MVYVPRVELDLLRQAANLVQQPGDYVFLSAKYDVTFDPRQPVIVEARYQVALMSPDEATIRLPLSNVTLAGANACRVNHRPHPIRKTDDAFLLTLNSSDSNSGRLQTLRPIGSGELRQPVRAVRPRAKEVAKSGGRSPKAALHGSKALLASANLRDRSELFPRDERSSARRLRVWFAQGGRRPLTDRQTRTASADGFGNGRRTSPQDSPGHGCYRRSP